MMLEWYSWLKFIHVASVSATLGLFMLRGGLMLADSPWRRHIVLKVLPHVVDTDLLASAIGLVIIIQQYPFVDPWLTAKVCGLFVYIGLGTVALKRGRTKTIRSWALLAALLVFAYIVSVALSHNAYGLLLAL